MGMGIIGIDTAVGLHWFHYLVSLLGSLLGVTLCSSVLEQAADMFYTVLEMGQIAHEDTTIRNIILN